MGRVFVSAQFEPGDRVVTTGISRLKALSMGMGGE